METDTQAKELIGLRYAHLKEMGPLGACFSIPGEESVMMCLFFEEDALLSGEIVEKTGLTTGHVANLLKKLEQKQLILRFQDQGDRRRVHVRLTEKGRQAAMDMQSAASERYHLLLSALGEADGAEWIRLMRRCLQALQTA